MYALKYCNLNRLSKKETMLVLQKAYGYKAMKKMATYKSYARFLDGQESICDEKCSGRPKIVMSNHVTVIKEQGTISKISGDYTL